MWTGGMTFPRTSRPLPHDHDPVRDFLSAVTTLEPTAIIGVSGRRGGFSPEILNEMARINERPIVFALSNPTDNSECTATEAYTHTRGQCIFASGSPFGPVTVNGQQFIPGQGNNVYIFPGMGLGAVFCQARHIDDEMFLEAAKTLAKQVSDADLAKGMIYPPLERIREVSLEIAVAVVKMAHEKGLANAPLPKDLKMHIKARMYDPRYEVYV